MRAAFDLSYLALDQAHRRLFRRLGLLAGVDFTAESAARLADGSLDTLFAANLVEQHLPGRYRLHDLLRLYASDRARSDDSAEEREQALDRLYGWYLDATYTATRSTGKLLLEPGTEVALPVSALDWLDSERANLVVVATHAPSRVRWLLADRLHTYLKVGRHAVDLGTICTAALNAAIEGNDERGRVAALFGMAATHSIRGRLGQAVEIIEQALATAWPSARVSLLYSLGHLLREMGDVDGAVDRYTAATEITASLGLDSMLPEQYFTLGTTCWMQDRLEESAKHLFKSHELAVEQGQDYDSMLFLATCGAPLRDLGRFDEAIDCLSRGIVAMRAAGKNAHLAAALNDLASTYCEMGRYEEALLHCTESLAITERMKDPAYEADPRVTLGRVMRGLDEPDEAVKHLSMALAAARSAGYRHAEVAALIAMFTEPDARQALTIAHEAGYRFQERRALEVLAALPKVTDRVVACWAWLRTR